MLFVMKGAISSDSQPRPPSTSAHPPRRRSAKDDTSSAITGTRSPQAHRPSVKMRHHYIKKLTPPSSVETPPPSQGLFDHASYPSPRREQQQHVGHDMDVEASEASSNMEDESLHDFFGEQQDNNLTSQLSPHTSRKPRRTSITNTMASMHQSMSAIQQSARSSLVMHRQSSISSLPLTTDESNNLNRMRKRASATQTKILNWTGTGNHIHNNNSKATATSNEALANNSIANVQTTPTNNSYQPTKKTVKRKFSLPNKFKTLLFKAIGSVLLFLLTAGFYSRRSYFNVTTSAIKSREAPYRQVLLQHEGMEEAPLNDPTSPAHQALDWISNQDPLQMRHTHPKLLQRWALAVVYFATHSKSADTDVDSKWKNETNWLSEKPVCDWYGITCEILSTSDWFDATMGEQHQQQTRDTQQMIEEEAFVADPKVQEQTPDVVRLDLSANQLKGAFPPELKHLSQLMSLDLSNNALSGALPQDPDTLGHYLRLTDLRLGHNRFTGDLPHAIGNNMILRQLQLDHNQFRGTIPAEWGHNLRNLRNWTMEQNFLTGPIPTTLGGMKHLERLEWNENQLTGALPFALSMVTTLKTVQLRFNSLIGSIPLEFIMTAKKLEVLDLGHNRLTGAVPDVMETSYAAPNLRLLHLDHNQLDGRLPKTLGQLTQLTSLKMDHNHLTGWIPVAWQRLEALQVLRLHDNKLGGTMPTQIDHLTNLHELQFQNNLLQPQLPKKILKKLPNLHYHSNGFYTSDEKDRVLDTELAAEHSRMRRQHRMMKDTLPKAQDATDPSVTTERHFDDEEM